MNRNSAIYSQIFFCIANKLGNRSIGSVSIKYNQNNQYSYNTIFFLLSGRSTPVKINHHYGRVTRGTVTVEDHEGRRESKRLSILQTVYVQRRRKVIAGELSSDDEEGGDDGELGELP